MTPGSLPFSEVVRVRFRDTDAQGHLYFANYMVYADEATGAYMEQLGYQGAMPQDAPAYVFTVNINCDYVGECKAGDQVRVCVGFRRLGNSSADVAFELYNDNNGELLAKGSITQVYVDKDTRSSCPIPQRLRSAIIERQGDALQEAG